jgi:hypothetical protein
MSDVTAIEEARTNYRTRVLVIGTALGALVGLAGAFLLIQNTERKGEEIQVSAGEGVKLGLIVMGLLRQVADL